MLCMLFCNFNWSHPVLFLFFFFFFKPNTFHQGHTCIFVCLTQCSNIHIWCHYMIVSWLNSLIFIFLFIPNHNAHTMYTYTWKSKFVIVLWHGNQSYTRSLNFDHWKQYSAICCHIILMTSSVILISTPFGNFIINWHLKVNWNV